MSALMLAEIIQKVSFVREIALRYVSLIDFREVFIVDFDLKPLIVYINSL